VDDPFQANPLPHQVGELLTSVAGDGAYDQNRVYAGAPSATPRWRLSSCRARTQRRATCLRPHPCSVTIEWQKRSGYTGHARAEAAIGRFKQVIGDGLRSRTDRSQATEVDVVVYALNRMLLVWTAPGGVGCARVWSVLISDKGDRPWTRLAG
jgi:hypothetical protein